MLGNLICFVGTQTRSCQLAATRNIPLGCHATIRTPKIGSGSGVNVTSKSPVSVKTWSLNWIISFTAFRAPKERTYFEGSFPNCNMITCRRHRKRWQGRSWKREMLYNFKLRTFQACRLTHAHQFEGIDSVINSERVFRFVSFTQNEVTTISAEGIT